MSNCFCPANILLPNFAQTDAKKWAVIACDQFTSQPEYWEDVAQTVKDAPSTLSMILPEVYLDEKSERTALINSAMADILENVLCEHPSSMIYTERTQSDSTLRRGLVLAVDLECYDFNCGASSLIRATEATVVERIPPRVEIRRNAPLELPHVMLLIDDPEHTVFGCLNASSCPRIAYDTELLWGGGHIVGRFLEDDTIRRVSDALTALISPDSLQKRYGKSTDSPLLFAVGDGNHSLATAKAVYEELKASLGDAALCHPARYALVEVVNIHEPSIVFEPIYRVLFGVDAQDVLSRFAEYAESLSGDLPPQSVQCLCADGQTVQSIPAPEKNLPVATLQDFIDAYKKDHPSAEVDYIHGIDAVRGLVRHDSVGFIFEGMSKDELFKTVMHDGTLPRKTFSMGHAEDKRYYMECRRISL